MDKLPLAHRRLLIYQWSRLLPSLLETEEALNENCVLENMAEQINEFTVGKEEVLLQLNLLNIYKAAGPDSLHPVIIKTLACVQLKMKTLSKPLQFSFKLWQVLAASPTHGSVQWLLPDITRVHSMMHAIIDLFLLLTFLCKVLEKLLCTHLYIHVRDNLSSYRHGFVHCKSCL